MKVRFLSPARQELVDAVEYYEYAVAGLGLEFLDELEAALARIQMQPEAWMIVSENHRRCRLRRFPYGVIYSINAGEIVVAAVMHLRRHPDHWKDRT